jgi:hypothetical protein
VQCGGTTKDGRVCTVATGGGRCEHHVGQVVEVTALDSPVIPPLSTLDFS